MIATTNRNFIGAVLTIVGGLALILLTACSSAQTRQASTESAFIKTYVFTCGDKFNFVARVEDNKAWLFLPGETLETYKVSDTLYRSLEVSLRLDGDKGSIESSQGNYENCRNNRRQAIWENAKLNGADFRAIGNEPGWHLEIRRQSKIVLVTNYGSEQYEFDLPEPESDTTARTTLYKVNQDGRELSLTISGEPCSDSMSGERFESKVEVVLNGKTLRGCGRALH